MQITPRQQKHGSMILLSYGNQNRPELLTERCIIRWSRIEQETQNKLHRSIFWHTSPTGRENINIGENEASYVLGFKVQVDSTKKNKDGCNQ